MRNLTLALVALLLAALAGCQVVTDNSGEEDGGFACLFDADRDMVGSWTGYGPEGWMDLRNYEQGTDPQDCADKAYGSNMPVRWLATDRIDADDADSCYPNPQASACDEDHTADDDDSTASDDDDSTASDDGGGDDNILSLSWESMGDVYGRLLLVGNPPNLPAQVFSNVVNRDAVAVDLYLNDGDYDQFQWIILGFVAEESYEDWQSCRAQHPINECWQMVDFESCTGDFETGEAFLVGRHSATREGDSRPVHASGNPYDGCIAVVN